MNEFGEPNMGNPSVRFDEKRERVIWILTTTVGSTPASLSCLLYHIKRLKHAVCLLIPEGCF